MSLYRLPFGPPSGAAVFTIGPGNWDDPNSGPHQEYAWDFSLMGAQTGNRYDFTVRAARAGVVYFVENTATDEETASGGAGNNVQIVHADGTNASYCHFKKGTILVKKDQWVPQGQALGTAGNTGTSYGIHVHYDVHTRACKPGQIRPLILTHLEDVTHASWRPFVGGALMTNNTVTRQDEWRQCSKCQGLAFSKNPGSNCPAGGGHAYLRYGGNFTLTHNRPDLGQANWHHCDKCQALFYHGTGVDTKCAESGTHSAAYSGNYSLFHDTTFPSGVGGWLRCWRCHGLFLGVHEAKSVCPSGSTHQADFDGLEFVLHCTLPDIEEGWRFCNKCAGLYYHPNAAQSKCPKDGALHTAGNTGNYWLTFNSADAPGQSNWRSCAKCEGLFYTGTTSGLLSVCPGGGAHQGLALASYVLVNSTASDAPGESNWGRCSKCQGLWYKLAASVCPAGSAHSSSDGTNYRLVVDYL